MTQPNDTPLPVPPAAREAEAAEPLSERLHAWLHDNAGRTFTRFHKLLVLLGIVAAWGVSELIQRLMGAPQVEGFSASLLQNSPPVLGAMVGVLAIVGGAAVCAVVAGRVRPEAPIFCAAVALLALRIHGGPTRLALMLGGGRPALLTMAVELAIYFATMVAVLLILRRLVSVGALPDDADRDGAILPVESMDQRLLCTATVVIVMAVIVTLLCQSDRPGQTACAVFLGSWLASWSAFRFIAVAPGVWYWAAPFVVGIAGYLYTAMYGSATAPIGQPGGLLAALARPVPLDYASLGVAGALIAYWSNRRHLREKAEAEAVEPPPPPQTTYSRG